MKQLSMKGHQIQNNNFVDAAEENSDEVAAQIPNTVVNSTPGQHSRRKINEQQALQE